VGESGEPPVPGAEQSEFVALEPSEDVPVAHADHGRGLLVWRPTPVVNTSMSCWMRWSGLSTGFHDLRSAAMLNG
jgi:hypothetical protein